MNKKGFLLVEILMGLFLLGLITVSCLPILNTALRNLQLSKDKMEMIYIAESAIEQLKSFDYNSTQKDEYLFDIQLIELADSLMDEEQVTIVLPLNTDNSQWKYLCTIHKEKDFSELWKISVEVSPIDKEQRLKDVTIVAFMPIPQK